MDLNHELDVPLRCVWDANAVLGEGPVWDEHQQKLSWVDVKSQLVHWYWPASELRQSFLLPQPIGACLPAADGRYLCALKKGLALVDLQAKPGNRQKAVTGDAIEWIDGPEANEDSNRFNDATTDAFGRLWVGSMDDAESDPTGALYRVDWDRSWKKVDDGYIVTNGPAISVDGKTLYHTDTFAGKIFAFDLDVQGNLARKRLHIHIPQKDGYPDGMTIDAEDHLWVAHFGGGRVTRFDPMGNVVAILRPPVSNITSCAFGGPEFDRLYITTARWTLDDAALKDQPLAGGLFVAEPGCQGFAMAAFGEKSPSFR